jgi:hypothetical protein
MPNSDSIHHPSRDRAGPRVCLTRYTASVIAVLGKMRFPASVESSERQRFSVCAFGRSHRRKMH